MRTKELDVIHSVANRIAHFEQKHTSDDDSVMNTSVMMNMSYNQKHKNQRLTSSSGSFGQRYLDLDDIMEEESSIEDDEDDRGQEDSDTGYIAGSNEETSSPDTSFRLSGRSSSSASDHSRSEEVRVNSEAEEINNKGIKAGISEKLSQKSLDSGFSDFSDSQRDVGSESMKEKRTEMKSSVVHETHATKDSKLHHVSKVYFYSVSDLLTQSSEDHLTLLKNESSNTCSSGHSSNPTTPRISSSVCDEDFFDRVESPFIPITSPSSQSPLQRCPRVHTGTSSLRRKASASLEDTEAPRTWTESPSESPVRRCLTPSQSPFPITNGSLYSDLSLQRRNKETQKRRGKSKSDTETENHQNNESPYPSLNASLPLESYGLNVSSSR